MTPTRGSVWWADLGQPAGSGPGFVRPVAVVSADSFNRSSISTVTVAIITSNTGLAESPGNVALPRREAGLPRRSVVNVTQVATIDKSALGERIGTLSADKLRAVDDGLRLAMGL